MKSLIILVLIPLVIGLLKEWSIRRSSRKEKGLGKALKHILV